MTITCHRHTIFKLMFFFWIKIFGLSITYFVITLIIINFDNIIFSSNFSLDSTLNSSSHPFKFFLSYNSSTISLMLYIYYASLVIWFSRTLSQFTINSCVLQSNFSINSSFSFINLLYFLLLLNIFLPFSYIVFFSKSALICSWITISLLELQISKRFSWFFPSH